MNPERETWRLGTELEIVADFDLGPLLFHLRRQVSVIRNSVDDGLHTLWVQLERTESALDDAVQRYVAMIEALPPHLRSLWDTSADRCFNAGIQAGWAPSAYPICLSAESIAHAARIAVRHQFTVYAAHDSSPSPA